MHSNRRFAREQDLVATKFLVVGAPRARMKFSGEGTPGGEGTPAEEAVP